MANDKWETPPEVVAFIENKFGDIQLDLCSSDQNKVCHTNLNEEDDFLDDEWLWPDVASVELGINQGGLCWCNPPYSNPLPFVKQCVKWAEAGYAIAGILNSDTSTKWFVELHKANAMFMPIIGGRIKFIGDDGKPGTSNNKPQFMFYLAPYLSHNVDTEYVNINEIYK